MAGRDPSDAFPSPAGSAGAAHFSGASSLARAERREALRARAEGRAPRAARLEGGAARPALAPEGEAVSRWPRPPACIPAARLIEPPQGARVAVCGLVIVRQRPGSAKGVIFVTLEDETGIVNVIVWSKIYERFRRAVIAARLMRATGRVQREGRVIHVVAETVEDVSPLLDGLAAPARAFDGALAPADEVRRPNERGSRPEKRSAETRARGLIRAAPRAMHPRDQAGRLFPERPDADP